MALSWTLLFDLDGTLVDTAHDLVGALNAVLASEQMAPVDFDVAVGMIGNGAKAMLNSAFVAADRPIDDARLELLMTRFIDHYRRHIADRSRPFPGTEAMLDRFAGAGWRLAVCTNKLEALAQSLLDELALSRRFAVIAGQDTFGLKKPDPRLLIETVRLAGGDARRSVMVGDSQFDIDAAKAAGMPVVAVEFGYSPVPVADLGPDAAIDHLDKLWDTVQPLTRRRTSP